MPNNYKKRKDILKKNIRKTCKNPTCVQVMLYMRQTSVKHEIVIVIQK